MIDGGSSLGELFDCLTALRGNPVICCSVNIAKDSIRTSALIMVIFSNLAYDIGLHNISFQLRHCNVSMCDVK